MMRLLGVLGLAAVVKAQSCGPMSPTCGPFIAEVSGELCTRAVLCGA